MLEVSARDRIVEHIQEDESPFEESVMCVRYQGVSLVQR